MAKPPEDSASDAAPADQGMLLDQAALDALLKAAAEADEAPAASGEGAEISEGKSGSGDGEGPLGRDDLDRPLDGRGMESVLAGQGALDQSEIDSLLAQLGEPPAVPASLPPEQAREQRPVRPADVAPVSRQMVDALVSAASDVEDAELAADLFRGGLSQVDLAPAPEAAREEQFARQRARQQALAEELGKELSAEVPVGEAEYLGTRPVADVVPKLSPRGGKVSLLKIAAALSMGVLGAVGTFSFVETHQHRVSDIPVPAVASSPPTGESGSDRTAQPPVVVGEQPMQAPALATPSQADAAFAELASAYKVLGADASPGDLEAFHTRINDFVNSAPNHSKAVEVLLWKAALRKQRHNPYLAREVYRQVLARYENAPHLDEVLLDAARIALQVRLPEEAQRYAKRLLKEHPESVLANEAEVTLADAYIATGHADEAQALFARLAESDSAGRSKADALTGLAQLAMDQGKYDDAIKRLEARVAMADIPEGNDDACLQLGRAYHAAGRLDDARAKLDDLQKRFPDSDLVPQALVELSRVLEDQGKRPEAIEVAKQAAQRYADNPQVLRNEGNFLALGGDHRQAAEVLMTAVSAGMNEPDVMLDAARHFRAAEALPEAQRVYERLNVRFPKSAQSLTGRVELAELLFQQGRLAEGVRRVENLAQSTPEGPQRLPVLLALANMHQRLGLRERASEVYAQAAALSREPEVRAQAAAALLDAGGSDAVTMAEQIDSAKVSDKTGYALLVKQGQALQEKDPRKAAELMYKAYTAYPKERTEDLEQRLLKGCLAINDTTRVQALIADLETQVRAQPDAAPRLRRAAVMWADHLYEKQDFRAAAEAYTTAIRADDGKSDEGLWAKYRRANSLCETKDFEQSAVLYDEVAESTSFWAKDAAIRAEHVRDVQRIRGLPVTAKVQTKTKQG